MKLGVRQVLVISFISFAQQFAFLSTSLGQTKPLEIPGENLTISWQKIGRSEASKLEALAVRAKVCVGNFNSRAVDCLRIGQFSPLAIKAGTVKIISRSQLIFSKTELSGMIQSLQKKNGGHELRIKLELGSVQANKFVSQAFFYLVPPSDVGLGIRSSTVHLMEPSKATAAEVKVSFSK
jgi:hypothetical protein